MTAPPRDLLRDALDELVMAISQNDVLSVWQDSALAKARAALAAQPTAAPAQGEPQDYISAASVAKVVAKLTDWKWLAEYASDGWSLPSAGTDALALLAGRAAAIMQKQAAALAALRAENERQARERSDMSVDIEKYRNEIAELKSERDAAQRAGVTTANYWMERAKLAEDQRERTRDIWATRAERAEAECEKLRADAERYRWIKSIELNVNRLNPCDQMRELDAEIDAAIDAAIDAEREGK